MQIAKLCKMFSRNKAFAFLAKKCSFHYQGRLKPTICLQMIYVLSLGGLELLIMVRPLESIIILHHHSKMTLNHLVIQTANFDFYFYSVNIYANLQSVRWVLAEFRHNRIVQSPHENYFNVCRQHKEKWDLVKMTSYSNWAIINYGVYKGLYHISCLLQIIKPFICPLQGLLFLVVKIL